jgi:hypothetical protein
MKKTRPVSAFSKSSYSGVILWVGNPNCQAAHLAVLAWLRQHCRSFIAVSGSLSESVKGNLGETISFCVGSWFDFRRLLPFPANAFAPLSSISRPDVDIVWIFLGKRSLEDFAILQEVKTTTASSLDYADKLIPDYEKLFGTNVTLSLHTRLQGIKNEVEYKLGRPKLCLRISDLAGKSPQTSPKIRLLPTLVHDLSAGNPVKKMVAIRSTLFGRGWLPGSVDPWAIGLSQLEARLKKLAEGKK